ncbi:MAG: hypothetical protein ABIE68_01700 [bacterium]
MKKFLMLMTMIFLLVFTFTISSQATLNQKTEEAMITATIEQMPGITDVAQQFFAITPNMDTANNAIKKNAIEAGTSNIKIFVQNAVNENTLTMPEVVNIIKIPDAAVLQSENHLSQLILLRA